MKKPRGRHPHEDAKAKYNRALAVLDEETCDGDVPPASASVKRDQIIDKEVLTFLDVPE